MRAARFRLSGSIGGRGLAFDVLYHPIYSDPRRYRKSLRHKHLAFLPVRDGFQVAPDSAPIRVASLHWSGRTGPLPPIDTRLTVRLTFPAHGTINDVGARTAQDRR